VAPANILQHSLPHKIAIVRLLPGLGDFLCIIPAVRALRRALPSAHIALIGLPTVKSLIQRFSHYYDELIEGPEFPGLTSCKSSVNEIVAGINRIQHQRLDLALQMHGNGSVSNSFTVLLGAKQNAGFYLSGQYCPDSAHFLEWTEPMSEILRYLALISFLGVPTQGDAIDFPLYPDDWQQMAQLLAVQGLHPEKQYVCLHPGASALEKCWSIRGFIDVINQIGNLGPQIVLTGTEAEAALTQAIVETVAFPIINLTGLTHLGTLAALYCKASLVICNDTGVSHLAAAVGVPSVVIFSNSDPMRWAPLNRDRHRVIQHTTASATCEAIVRHAKALLQASSQG
jgi:ADP-heptose:LPS heptosyltransferase